MQTLCVLQLDGLYECDVLKTAFSVSVGMRKKSCNVLEFTSLPHAVAFL